LLHRRKGVYGFRREGRLKLTLSEFAALYVSITLQCMWGRHKKQWRELLVFLLQMK